MARSSVISSSFRPPLSGGYQTLLVAIWYPLHYTQKAARMQEEVWQPASLFGKVRCTFGFQLVPI
jgi:hypothetical protein